MRKVGFSANIINRLKRNGYILLQSIESICNVLECGVDDTLEFIPEKNSNVSNLEKVSVNDLEEE